MILLQKDTIDILLATYNTDVRFLKAQLDSILNQTYKNIKIYISDDKSTSKETTEFLDSLSKEDERITVYMQNENLGYIKNFEFLLKQSTSNYVAYSDHDDIWYEYKIEEMINKIKLDDTDLVYSDCKYIDENGNTLKNSYLEYKNLPKIQGKDNILAFSRHIAIGCSQLFTKAVVEKVLPFENHVIAHDWNTMYVASKLKGISYIDKPLFDYRVHAGNVFGGKNVVETKMNKWKKENGSSYRSFLKYRDEVINVYADGANMCYNYSSKLKQTNEQIKKEKSVIKYYEDIKKSRVVNFRVDKYKKYLSFNGIGKRAIKEILFFHLPIIAYLVYLK